MDENSLETIRSIKSKIIAMLEERHRRENKDESFASPSKYWSDFCSFFDYMLGLPEESFSKLRLHTYHLTTDNYQTYYFNRDGGWLKVLWQERIKDIPPEYILYEPDGGIGYSLGNGKLISYDSFRFQENVDLFRRHGLLSSAGNGQERKFVLEIGAGYGGLVHHLSDILENVTCIIVDLPETLIFSAPYLSLHNPDKRIYIYEESSFAERVNDFKSFDFVLIPNYKLDELRGLRFDLVINIGSLQEMRTDQVNRYLDFIAENCTGAFYSYNQDAQPKNSELRNLTEMIGARFEITEIKPPATRLTTKEKMKLKLRQVLKSVAIFIGLWHRGPLANFSEPPFREYVCRPLRDKNIR